MGNDMDARPLEIICRFNFRLYNTLRRMGFVMAWGGDGVMCMRETRAHVLTPATRRRLKKQWGKDEKR